MMPLEEFILFYNEKGYFPFQTSIKKSKRYNRREFESKYKSYIKFEKRKLEKFQQSFQKDEKWESLKEEVHKRDISCQFLKCLNLIEHSIIIKDLWGFNLILDCAHIIGRARSNKLKYDIDNVVLLTRYAHSNIDKYIDPITGKSMTEEERDLWWVRIVGKERFEKLIQKSKER